MVTKPGRARLSVDITDEQMRALNMAVPYGWRKPVFSTIVDQVVKVAEQYGEVGLALIVQNKVSLISLLGGKDGDSRRSQEEHKPNDRSGTNEQPEGDKGQSAGV